MAEPFLISSVFLEYILPFVLIFTLVFAILQKSKILGEGKKQIDAIVGLVVGLILIAFPFSRDIVVRLMPFLAVTITILLVFMIFYGLAYGNVEMNKWIKAVFLIIFSLALVTVFLFITGWWDPIYDFMFNRSGSGQVWINILLIIIIAAAVVAVLKGKGSEGKSKEE